MSQCRTVLRHLQQNDHLTSMQAVLVYRIPRLASRIYDLRQAGHNIVSNAAFDARGQEYTRYRLVA
jgi:hypothetical protein